LSCLLRHGRRRRQGEYDLRSNEGEKADAARGSALDFFAPFLEVVFTIDEFRLGLATNGL
jgi:hypothetical protein